MRTPDSASDERHARHRKLVAGGSDLGFVDAYLSRIGLAPANVSSPDLDDHDVLERVVRAQLATIPFENLMIHADQIVNVDPAAIERKIIGGKRGGICYEVNGLLARGLQGLGFEVHLVGATVERESGDFGPALGHMVVLATAGDRHWLVDTGFGGSSVLTQISAEQAGSPMDISTSTGRYRTDGTTHHLADFADIAHWQSTSPAARFTGSIICSVTDDTHRITMSRGRSEHFTLTRTDLVTGEQHRMTIAEDAVCAVFDNHFGISLAIPPVVAEFL